METDENSFQGLVDDDGVPMSVDTTPSRAESLIEPEPRHVFTEDEVQGVINRMKLARADCPKCPQIGYQAVWQGYWFQEWLKRVEAGDPEVNEPIPVPRAEAATFMRNLGFEQAPARAGWIKSCAECADSKRFPWADQLDAPTVRDFMNTDERCAEVFDLSILQETL